MTLNVFSKDFCQDLYFKNISLLLSIFKGKVANPCRRLVCTVISICVHAITTSEPKG